MRNLFGHFLILLFPLMLFPGCGPSSEAVVTTYFGQPIVFLHACDEADITIAFDDDSGNALAETVKCGAENVYTIIGRRTIGFKGDEYCEYEVEVNGAKFKCKSISEMSSIPENMFAFSRDGKFPTVFLPMKPGKNLSPRYQDYNEPSGGWDITNVRTETEDYSSDIEFGYALVSGIVVCQIKLHVLTTKGTEYTIEYSDYQYDDDDNLMSYKAHIKVKKESAES